MTCTVDGFVVVVVEAIEVVALDDDLLVLVVDVVVVLADFPPPHAVAVTATAPGAQLFAMVHSYDELAHV